MRSGIDVKPRAFSVFSVFSVVQDFQFSVVKDIRP